MTAPQENYQPTLSADNDRLCITGYSLGDENGNLNLVNIKSSLNMLKEFPVYQST